MTRVREAHARLVFDSRGKETVEVRLVAEGVEGSVAAPSGASTGTHEVVAFPEGGAAAAVATFRRVVAPRLVGAELGDQARFDSLLHEVDGTPNFSRIGGNTASAASVAAARTEALARGRPLWEQLKRPGIDGRTFPAIVGNCLNGGRHAIGGPEIQEFHAYATSPDPESAVRAALAVHREVGRALEHQLPKYALGRGDEGGWVAPLGNREALEILASACAKVRDDLHLPVHPGLDLAASEFFRDGQYRYRERSVDAEGQVEFLTRLVEEFDLRYLEDPFDQEDFGSFAALTKAVGRRCVVVGDDLYTTRLDRVRRGVEQGASNSVLIKVNQVGTLTDTFGTVDFARSNGLSTVTSHRSGDLPDGWLAHLAVATGAVGLKCGLLGGERVAKLNELLRLGGPH